MKWFDAAFEKGDQEASAALESALDRLLESHRELAKQLFDNELPEILTAAHARIGRFDRTVAFQQAAQLKHVVYNRLGVGIASQERNTAAGSYATAVACCPLLSQDANIDIAAERSKEVSESLLHEGDYLQQELHLAAIDFAEKRLEKVVARLQDILRDQREPQIVAYISHGVGVAFMELGDLPTARSYLEKALLLIHEASPDTDPPDILDDLSMLSLYQGDLSASMRILHRGLMASLRLGDQERTARLSEHIGLATWKSGYPAKSVIWLILSLAWRIQQQSPDRVADSLDSLGRVCSSMELRHLALALHWSAMDYRSNESDQPAIAKTWTNLGTALRRAKQLRSALRCHQEAMWIRRRVRDRVGMANSRNNLGLVLMKMGRFRRARKQVRKAFRIRWEMGDSVNVSRNLVNLECIERHLRPQGRAGGNSL